MRKKKKERINCAMIDKEDRSTLGKFDIYCYFTVDNQNVRDDRTIE